MGYMTARPHTNVALSGDTAAIRCASAAGPRLQPRPGPARSAGDSTSADRPPVVTLRHQIADAFERRILVRTVEPAAASVGAPEPSLHQPRAAVLAAVQFA